MESLNGLVALFWKIDRRMENCFRMSQGAAAMTR